MKKFTLIALVTVHFCSGFTRVNEPSKDILGTWKIVNSSLDGVTKAAISLTIKKNPAFAQQMEDNYEVICNVVRQN